MMITNNDIGSIFSLNESRNLIMIDDITDEYVYYRNELGETFTMTNQEIDGIIVSDPQRISLFRDNMSLGAALSDAEASALIKMLVGSKHDPEVLEATSVLETIHKQQETLRLKIQSYGKANFINTSSLDDKIQSVINANDDTQDLQNPFIFHER